MDFTGHLKWKGTRMAALLEMAPGSARITPVCPVPKVQGGSAEITSSECFRQMRKKMLQSRVLLQKRRVVLKECTFSSNTPDEATYRKERSQITPLLLRSY